MPIKNRAHLGSEPLSCDATATAQAVCYPRSPRPMNRSVPPPLVHSSLNRFEKRSGSVMDRPIL